MPSLTGVVPAAGRGTRLGDRTDDRPKGLVDVGGQPLLTHVFETLRDAGADDVVVVVGYEGAQIVDRFGASFRDCPVTYVEQADRLGLGHAVLQAAPHVDERFVVVNGDNLFGGSIRPALERAADPGVDAVLAVEAVDGDAATETGVVETRDGRITRVVEKPDDPPSTLATTGCYVLPPAVFHALRLCRPSDRGEYELSEAVDLLVRAGYDVVPERLQGWRVNVNRPADVDRAEERLADDA